MRLTITSIALFIMGHYDIVNSESDIVEIIVLVSIGIYAAIYDIVEIEYYIKNTKK